MQELEYDFTLTNDELERRARSHQHFFETYEEDDSTNSVVYDDGFLHLTQEGKRFVFDLDQEESDAEQFHRAQEILDRLV